MWSCYHGDPTLCEPDERTGDAPILKLKSKDPKPVSFKQFMIFALSKHNVMNPFNTHTNYSNRVYGLDVFRAVAIILVVLSHGGFIIDKALPGFPWVGLIDGVELFFVLSGFLIGTILIKIYENEEPETGSLISFWKRRWYRTLPNYYLILLVNVIFVYTGIIKGNIDHFNWKFLFFLQNFHEGFTDFFWESWSLTIEEWFYVLTPLSIGAAHWAGRKFISRKNIVLLLVAAYILLPLLYRISISHQQLDNFWIDVQFRKVVMTRLDAIMFGVFFAWLKYYHISLFKKIAAPAFIGGLILMYTAMHISKGEPLGFYSKTFYFSCIGIGASLLLPFADSVKKFKTPIGKAVTHISLISYSMYLVNLSVVAQVIEVHFMPESKTASVLTYLAYWLVVIVLSTIIYKFFEKPVMDLRDRSTRKVSI